MTDKENIITLPGEEEIEAEAAAWLVVLERDDLDEEDLADFKKWRNQSARHRAAFDQLAVLWEDMSALRELDDIAESVSTIVKQHQPRASRVGSSNHRPLKRRAFMPIAASILIGFIAVALLSQQHLSSLVKQEVFITAVGEQRTIELPDGSSLYLNTDSRLQVDYSRTSRSIHLSRGEAHFDVAKNPNRPFYVYAGDGVVQAVGTAFTVRLRQHNEVEVTVEEGRVALATLTEPDRSIPENPRSAERVIPQQKLAELTAGQSTVFVGHVEQIAQMQTAEINRKLAWRQGMLAYAEEPLFAVVADVSRYTDITIEIADAELSAMPVAGYFRVGEVEALFDSLKLTFGLKVEYVSDSHVRLSALR